jgi:hypothetical protein
MKKNGKAGTTNPERFEAWAIVELMGHVKMAGRILEEERFGVKMGRIDIPGPGKTFVTQWFSGSSVYRITPVTEEVARAVARNCMPEPVHTWELRLPAPAKAAEDGGIPV